MIIQSMPNILAFVNKLALFNLLVIFSLFFGSSEVNAFDYVSVPDLSKETATSATPLLTSLGLRSRIIKVEAPSKKLSGKFKSQYPPANIAIKKGSVVTLRVYTKWQGVINPEKEIGSINVPTPPASPPSMPDPSIRAIDPHTSQLTKKHGIVQFPDALAEAQQRQYNTLKKSRQMSKDFLKKNNKTFSKWSKEGKAKFDNYLYDHKGSLEALNNLQRFASVLDCLEKGYTPEHCAKQAGVDLLTELASGQLMTYLGLGGAATMSALAWADYQAVVKTVEFYNEVTGLIEDEKTAAQQKRDRMAQWENVGSIEGYLEQQFFKYEQQQSSVGNLLHLFWDNAEEQWKSLKTAENLFNDSLEETKNKNYIDQFEFHCEDGCNLEKQCNKLSNEIKKTIESDIKKVVKFINHQSKALETSLIHATQAKDKYQGNRKQYLQKNQSLNQHFKQQLAERYGKQSDKYTKGVAVLDKYRNKIKTYQPEKLRRSAEYMFKRFDILNNDFKWLKARLSKGDKRINNIIEVITKLECKCPENTKLNKKLNKCERRICRGPADFPLGGNLYQDSEGCWHEKDDCSDTKRQKYSDGQFYTQQKLKQKLKYINESWEQIEKSIKDGSKNFGGYAYDIKNKYLKNIKELKEQIAEIHRLGDKAFFGHGWARGYTKESLLLHKKGTQKSLAGATSPSQRESLRRAIANLDEDIAWWHKQKEKKLKKLKNRIRKNQELIELWEQKAAKLRKKHLEKIQTIRALMEEHECVQRKPEEEPLDTKPAYYGSWDVTYKFTYDGDRRWGSKSRVGKTYKRSLSITIVKSLRDKLGKYGKHISIEELDSHGNSRMSLDDIPFISASDTSITHKFTNRSQHINYYNVFKISIDGNTLRGTLVREGTSRHSGKHAHTIKLSMTGTRRLSEN